MFGNFGGTNQTEDYEADCLAPWNNTQQNRMHSVQQIPFA